MCPFTKVKSFNLKLWVIIEILEPEMNSQLIVIIQVLIASTFILWILSRRGGSPKPTVLNMRAVVEMKKQQLVVMDEHNEVKAAKALNVIFMWNGYGWDAYEVFGLPAGTSLIDVKIRYQELLSEADEGQRQFLQTALDAIENKMTG